MKKFLFGILIAIAMVIGGLALTVPVSKVSASDCPPGYHAVWVKVSDWLLNPIPGKVFHIVDGYGYYCDSNQTATPTDTPEKTDEPSATPSPTLPVSATPSSTAVVTVVKTEEITPTGNPTNEVTPTGLPTALPTEEVTPTEPPRCDGDCPTATVSPTIVPTVVVSQTPPPTGGGQCATSNFKFDVGENLVAYWMDSGAKLQGSIFTTQKGEIVIYWSNGERNSGKLNVTNEDRSKSQIVDVGATGCDSKPEITVTATASGPTPVPYNEDRGNIKLKVDCTGYTTLTFDGTKFDYSRAVYSDSSGNHGLIFSPATGGWAARIPLRDDVVSVTAWVVDSKNSLITVTITVDFTDCPRPVTEIKAVASSTPVPTPNPYSVDRAAITLNVGVAGLSKDPGIVLFPNGQKFESMWLELNGQMAEKLETWTNNLSVCQNLILANFDYIPAQGETAEIVAIMGGHYTVRTVVQTTGNGSDVNCSNLHKYGEAWLAHWYGGNTYQSWYKFLGFNGSYEQFVNLMEEARGKSHAEIFELPKAVIDSSSIFSNNE